jgi:acyl transferase domain-containing protein/acyl carrier protein
VEPVAIIGVGAILPDAPDAPTFWRNVAGGRYSVSEVDPHRWDPELYYDPDPKAPDKTYSKIGGWVREWAWEPLAWKLPIPPLVSDAMDDAQKWAVACTRELLADHGREIDRDRTAVIIGNAMAGEKHYETNLRVSAPEILRYLAATEGFAALAPATRQRIGADFVRELGESLPPVTEDTMPGELGNVLAGRIANLFNLHGPNYIVDAACASAMAAIDASVAGLNDGDFDTVITGGVDRNNGASSFIKFCAIGALSATGTRPFDAGADGFVMGEGAALFLLKRLADAERDGDRIYAVIRGIGGASDGKGKGITAPNPVGQRLAVERAWRDAGISPGECSLVEAHGTSTRVGDVVEVGAIGEAFSGAGLEPHRIALGSVKSNIGHLKAAAGAAGILKTVLAIHHGQIPPSLNFATPNPNVDWSVSPFQVSTELTEWRVPAGRVRTAGVSAFGFGGTNFHTVVEQYVPGRIPTNGRHTVAAAVGAERPAGVAAPTVPVAPAAPVPKAPLRGATVVGAADEAGLATRLREVAERASAGDVPEPRAPLAADLAARHRVAIDHADAQELAEKAAVALAALDKPAMWKPLRSRGVFHGQGARPGLAFLYPGQGSQYVNMLAGLRALDPIVAETIDAADRAMGALLDRPLSSYFLVDADDPDRLAQAELELRATEITQPALLTTDEALTRMLAAYGIVPDMVMGHSLGEYAALVAAGSLTFGAALEAVSARGHEMASLEVDDPGAMAAVFAPIDEVEAIVAAVDGYAVLANVNSTSQSVVGGETAAVQQALALCAERGFTTFQLPVSHAFHTRIVAAASEPLRRTLERLELRAPDLPVVSNVTGGFYPTGADARERMLELLAEQVASPVQFVTGLRSLHEAGARVFVEVGPKRALQGLASDVLGDDEVLNLFTNHPKFSDAAAFNQALCGLYAAGFGEGRVEAPAGPVTVASGPVAPPAARSTVSAPVAAQAPTTSTPVPSSIDDHLEEAEMSASDRSYLELGRALGAFLERSQAAAAPATAPVAAVGGGRDGSTEPVVISGAALGLPGTPRLFDDEQVARILRGQQFIGPIPDAIREEIADRRITRLVKGDRGEASFETIDDPAAVIKLAARSGELDLAEEFGIDADRVAALGWSTQLAIAAGVDALRDAGIPIVQHYRTTGVGSQLPDRWGLPTQLRDDTGVIFASAFPGLEEMTDEVTRYQQDVARREQRGALASLRDRVAATTDPDSAALAAIDEQLADLDRRIEAEAYRFDRRFLFRVLSMGHSQFAELIGARGPNTQINSACASTTQAVALAEDWIRAGRCRRVIVIAADDASSDGLLPWIGAGFLATGAAATDAAVEDAALPFDRRRHGMLIGMGAASIVIESADAARERGITPICEVLGASTANSAFHGTRLDVEHIGAVMEDVVTRAEARGVDRHAIVPETVFVSHETYTPARGGSAAAEIHALKQVFGTGADQIVIANTKGVTGHPMGVGVEDIVAIKALETGLVPPVPNFRDVDPELGQLNLSRGGAYPVRYALRLAAGFGSQISMMLLRWTPVADGQRRAPEQLGFDYRVSDPVTWQRWLDGVTGRPDAQLEVAHRWLRVIDRGPVAQPAPAVEAAPAAAPASTAPVAASVPAPDVVAPASVGDPVEEQILGLVAEQTGYPSDMLDLDLDLEADLGIDTVKQAELFVSVRETYDIERDDSLQLRDYPTLAHVIGFVRERRPDLVAASVPAPDVVAPASVGDPVEEQILGLVAEQTGYPSDMLDLDLDLEADLGIDTVKQAELFVSVRETYDIERDDSLQLRDYPTLAHVIGFVRERRPDLVAASVPAPDVVAPASVGDPVEEQILGLVAEQTGYPSDMLDLDLDLEADLGIDTVKQAELFVSVRETYDIERDDSLQLRDYPTLAHVIGFVRERRPDLVAAAPVAASMPTADELAPSTLEVDTSRFPRRVPVSVVRPSTDVCVPTGVLLDGARVVVLPDHGGVAEAVTAALEERGARVLTTPEAPTAEALEEQLAIWRADGPITAVLGLAGLDLAPFSELTAETWKEGLRVRVKLLATTARALYDDLGPGAAFLTGTRLGGRFGYDECGAQDVLGGAVSGFTKGLARERDDATVKVVDHAPETDAATIAAHLIDELLADPSVIEVGYADGLRTSVGLHVQPTEPDEALALGPDQVFVITGAAGSIVSAITADLATSAGGGTFHLLDLTPEPDRDDADLVRFVDDPDGLKTDLAQRIQDRGEKVTPVKVNRALAGIERSRAALDTILAVEAAGGTAHWHQVDLTDGEAVGTAMATATETTGRVDVLMHAGGLEISHNLPDKPQAEYDLVFDVKADGLFHCLAGLGDAQLGNLVVFSSIAGRFGNGAQTDYSAANDLLCKTVSSLRTSRPGTRGIALDWTAWGGIGMATRGSIPKMMEFAGIDMLPPGIGIPIVRQELEAAGDGGEVVVAGSLGILLDERHPTGGVDPEAVAAAIDEPGPMLGEVIAHTLADGLVTERELDAAQPFLDDHRIDGTPVLPGVMSVEAFAEVANLLVPDRHVVAIEDVEFAAPFKLYRDESRTARISARLRPGPDGSLVADCRLVGRRTLANGTDQVTDHASARVVLAAEGSEAPVAVVPSADAEPVVDAEAIYRIYFHGPTYQVLARAWRVDGEVVGQFAADLPANHRPAGAPTNTAPRLLELCFQVAGVHELGTSHRMALPARIDRVELFGRVNDSRPHWAVVRPTEGGADAEVIDEDGRVALRLRGYGTVVLPDGPVPELLAPLRAAME